MQFGAHVSVAGGLHNATSKGKAIGAEVLQIFVSPPQTFRVTDYSDEAIEEFKKLYQTDGFRGLFLHAIYLINLASGNPRLVDLSKASLIHYLKMGDKLGAVGTIVHVGSMSKKTEERGLKMDNDDERWSGLIRNIKDVLNQTPPSQKLIIENCAAGKIGKNLDELERLCKQINDERINFCIDTQHLFASGVDVRDYQIFESWLHDFDERIGIDNLACIHANDSKSELGSAHDRHENIGEGKIGQAGFTNILRQPLLQDKPFIIETPGFDQKGPDKENLDRIKMLVKK